MTLKHTILPYTVHQPSLLLFSTFYNQCHYRHYYTLLVHKSYMTMIQIYYRHSMSFDVINHVVLTQKTQIRHYDLGFSI